MSTGRGTARTAAALLVTAAASAALAAPPPFERVRDSHRPSDAELLDRHGEPLQRVRVDATVRRAPWLPLAAFSPALRAAVLAGEDRGFASHRGVDWPALAAGAWAQARGAPPRGASTITMQLAALLDPGLARPAGGRGVADKWRQIDAARALEAAWTKDQILEAYLNRVPLRGDLVGVPAAARALFGKSPAGLDAVQGALIAALLPAPNAAPAAVERRACALLRAQQRDCAGLALETAVALSRPPRADPGPGLAPHFARHALATRPATGPWRSTLDARLQRLATRALREQLSALAGRGAEDGAVVVIDNASGEVRAWVGSSGPLSRAPEVDGVLARRQPGSTLKPFIYALALERGLVTPRSWLRDSPLQLASGDARYEPENHDRTHRGWVPLPVALASSLNVPAVRLATAVGVDDLFERLDAAGLRLEGSGGFHGPALALGSAEVTLLDLTNAYRMLARDGRWSPARWSLPAPAQDASRAVFSPDAARAVAAMLADGAARAPTFGFDSPLALRRPAAVKTGTSKDMRDNWCVGWTAGHTIGVWVGHADGRPMQQVSGTDGAAPVWAALASALGDAGGIVGRGAEGRDVAVPPPGPLAGPAAFGIESPGDGSVWVIDPAIPPSLQRIPLRGAAGRWRLGGEVLGEGEALAWTPRAGRHRLELLAADGRPMARVDFEVRPGWRAAPPLRRPAGR